MGSQVITEIVTPATGYDLVDLNELKEDLQLAGSADDGFLERVIRRASAAAAQYCNRVFVVEQVRDRFVPGPFLGAYPVRTGSNRLQLSRWPVVPTQDVVVSVTSAPTQTFVAGTDFLVDGPSGQLIRLAADGSETGWSPAAISVTYTAGFDPIPYDVADAVTRLIKARLAARTRDPLLRSETIPGVSTSTWWVSTGEGGDLPPDVADALDRYRVPVIA